MRTTLAQRDNYCALPTLMILNVARGLLVAIKVTADLAKNFMLAP
jgi:hypothetical protein